MAEAVLEEQVELLLHKALHHHPAQRHGGFNDSDRGAGPVLAAVVAPFELLQGAGVGVRVGRGRGRRLLRLQAVGEAVQMFDQETHQQHVLLCRGEGLLEGQPVRDTRGHPLQRPVRKQPSGRSAKAPSRGVQRSRVRPDPDS